MFDSIAVGQRCPYCKDFSQFEAQTKDLDSALWNFETLSKDWFDKKRKVLIDRNKISVFKRTPYDKSNKVWKSQGEQMEALAKVPKEFEKLKYVNVIVTCSSEKCQEFADERDIRWQGIPSGFGRRFEGKIKIKNGYLIGEIYDIKLVDKKLPKRQIQKRLKVVTPEALINKK